jgi:hypothetical protein
MPSFPTTATPAISSSEFFPPSIALALTTLAAQVIADLTSLADAASGAGFCRNVVTSLAAYTGSGTGVLTASANGVFGAQDGVTNANGDVVFIEEGTTNLTAAKDAGPWVCTSIGASSAEWKLTRPTWWAHGQAIPQAAVIKVGGEGTKYPGSDWKTFVASGKVVDTDAPTFWVRTNTQAVTLGGSHSFVTKTNVGIRSATETMIAFQNTGPSGITTTVDYVSGAISSAGSATVAGVIGTGSVSITGVTSGATASTTDISTGLLQITNW